MVAVSLFCAGAIRKTGGTNRRYIIVHACGLCSPDFCMTLLGHREAKTTYLGITILIGAAAIVPWLAKEKRKPSATTGSAALRADAAESALCAYFSVIALVGLAIDPIWHIWWADPDCCSCDCSAHRMVRKGSHVRQSLWLLLILASKDLL